MKNCLRWIQRHRVSQTTQGSWGMSKSVDVADLCMHDIGCCSYLGKHNIIQVNFTFCAVTKISSNFHGISDPRPHTF